MKGMKKCSSCSASMEGTTVMDMDGVAFFVKQLEDEGVMKTNVLRIVLSLERCCYGRRWVGGNDIGMWMVTECGRK